MTTLLIVNYSIKDAQRFNEYRAVARPAILAGGGRLLTLADSTDLGEARAAGGTTAVLVFADRETALSTYQSDAYQAALAVRLEATSHSSAVLVDLPPGVEL
jgi:uncharacterized protein (DUF1330 family)